MIVGGSLSAMCGPQTSLPVRWIPRGSRTSLKVLTFLSRTQFVPVIDSPVLLLRVDVSVVDS